MKNKIKWLLSVSVLLCCVCVACADMIRTFDNGDTEGFGINLGTEFPGAKGSACYTNVGYNSSGALIIEADFSEGGFYVASGCTFESKFELTQVSFMAKSSELKNVTLRLTDVTWQVHQQKIDIVPDGEWHEYSVKNFTSGKGYQCWGGKKDGNWDDPVKLLLILVDKGGIIKDKTGSVFIDNLTVKFSDREIKPYLEIDDLPLGNIFTVGEGIKVSGITEGNSVSWVLRDARKAVVGKGRVKVPKDGAISLDIKDIYSGYYTLNITSFKGDVELSSKTIPIANLMSTPDIDARTTPFGVCTHFSQGWNIDFMQVLKRAGIMTIRDENSWNSIEKEKGVFSFSDRYTKYVQEVGRLNMDVLMVMGFGNKLYATQDEHKYWRWAAPYKHEHYEAYANYVAEVLKKYPEEIKFIEIWNEYNGGFCPGPAQGRPEIYAEMYKVTYKVVKKLRPDITVLACSTVGAPKDWIKKAVTLIGSENVDGVAVHPYRYHISPEGLCEQIRELDLMLRELNNGNEIPIWCTEQGWFSKVKGSKRWTQGLTRLKQSSYLVRSYVEQLAGGADKVYWYVGRDYPSFPTMGVVEGEQSKNGRYAPHESLPAYAVMVQKLNDKQIDKRLDVGENIYCYRFGDKETVDVIWSTVPATLKVKTKGTVCLTDMFGKPVEMTPVDGYVYILVDSSVFYLEGDVESITLSDKSLCSTATTLAENENMRLAFNLNGVTAGKVSVRVGDLEEQLNLNIFDIDILPVKDLKEFWTFVNVNVDGRCFIAGLRKTEVVKPVNFSENIFLDDEGLHVQLNNSSEIRTFKVKNLKVKINGMLLKNDVQDKELKPGTSLSFVFPSGKSELFEIVPISVSAEFDKLPPVSITRNVSISPLQKHSIVVDGKLDDWQEIKGISIADLEYVKLEADCKGADDLGGILKICFDEKSIYISADVTDDVFSQDFDGWDVWKGDNIQFAISPLPPWGTMPAGNFLHELGLTLTKNGEEFYRFNGEGKKGKLVDVQLKIIRDGNRTIYEAAFPWETILGMSSDSCAFSFGFLINDNDGTGREGMKQWCGVKSPVKLQYLQFVESPK
jgi:hypothetical protein